MKSLFPEQETRLCREMSNALTEMLTARKRGYPTLVVDAFTKATNAWVRLQALEWMLREHGPDGCDHLIRAWEAPVVRTEPPNPFGDLP